MRDIIIVPIEPLDERYTSQWYRRFPLEFAAAGYNVVTIDGKPLLDNEIKVGSFLDVNSTVHYKMTQLQAISALFHSGKVKQGTIFFFADIEFWGLESVRLLAQLNNVEIKICGFLHAASYTKEDAFAVAAPYQSYTEVGWIAALDAVFVGSEYHKQAVIDRRLIEVGATHLADRIKVTKNPLFIDEYHAFDVPKQKKVLLTNRTDQEKRPEETLKLFEALKAIYSDWEFVVTTGRPALRGDPEFVQQAADLQSRGIITVKAGLTKEQYHRELAEAYMVVSHSVEENYGYCLAEALHYNCIPFYRKCASHPELVDNTSYCLFDGSYYHLDGYNLNSQVVRASQILDMYPHTNFFDSRLAVIKATMYDGMSNILKEIKLLDTT